MFDVPGREDYISVSKPDSSRSKVEGASPEGPHPVTSVKKPETGIFLLNFPCLPAAVSCLIFEI
jgi:hypothetical protein